MNTPKSDPFYYPYSSHAPAYWEELMQDHPQQFIQQPFHQPRYQPQEVRHPAPSPTLSHEEARHPAPCPSLPLVFSETSASSPSLGNGKRTTVSKEERVIRNREAVRRCRKRKQTRADELEIQVAHLERENCTLKCFIESKGLKEECIEHIKQVQEKELQKSAKKGSRNLPDNDIVHNVYIDAMALPVTPLLRSDDWNARIEDIRAHRLQVIQIMASSINMGGVAALLERDRDIWCDDFILVQGFSGTEISGMAAIKEWWISNEELVPDLKITKLHLQPRTESADKVRAEWTMEGTFATPETLLSMTRHFPSHSVGGNLMTAIAPMFRNKRVSISGFSHFIFRGLLLEQVVHSYNCYTLLEQVLGMQCTTVVDQVATLVKGLSLAPTTTTTGASKLYPPLYTTHDDGLEGPSASYSSNNQAEDETTTTIYL